MNDSVNPYYLITLLFPLLSIFGCGNHDVPELVEANTPCLTGSMAEQVTIEEVISEPVYDRLVLPGQIMVNRDRVFKVYPVAGGVITDVHVRVGDPVHKGQILATIQSPDVAAFHRDRQSAEAELSISERNLNLAQSLLESGVYSERDLLEAQRAMDRALAEMERIKEQQNVMGLEDGESVYSIRAPENGVVVDRAINPGLTLRAYDQHAFEISDLSEVWVVAHVPESEIRNVSDSAEVRISTLAYPDQLFTGNIVRLSSTIDPERRAMEAIVELPNPDQLLKPGMFATIEIETLVHDPNLPVNSQAIIFDQNESFLVVYRDVCDMEVRPVTISSRTRDNVFIESGIEAGESIVSSRHLLIYNQLTASR